MFLLKHGRIIFVLVCGLCLISTANAKKAEFFKSQKHFDLIITEDFEENTPSYQRSIKRKLKFKLKKDGKEKNIDWNGPLHSISDNIYSFNSKVLLEGKLPMSGSSTHGKTLILLDADKGVVQDTIRCFDYSLSPSKRFLIYSTWYPRMIPGQLRKSIILSYDLIKSADENRLSFVNKFTYRNAGLPIFPEYNANFKNLDPNDIENGIDDSVYDIEPVHEYFLNSPFLWSEDETKLVFMVYDNDLQKNYLIKILFGSRGFSIDREYIDIDKLVKSDILLESTKQELSKRVYSLSVKSIAWEKDNKVLIKPYEQYWLDKEILLELP